jgi:DNA-binding SARP family transcriptional activator
MTEPSTQVLSFHEPSSARFELRCWGEFRLFDRLHAAECLPPRRKARAIIAYLAAHGGTSISRERLAAVLWSERGDEQARASLSARPAMSDRRHLRTLAPLQEEDIRADCSTGLNAR